MTTQIKHGNGRKSVGVKRPGVQQPDNGSIIGLEYALYNTPEALYHHHHHHHHFDDSDSHPLLYIWPIKESEDSQPGAQSLDLLSFETFSGRHYLQREQGTTKALKNVQTQHLEEYWHHDKALGLHDWWAKSRFHGWNRLYVGHVMRFHLLPWMRMRILTCLLLGLCHLLLLLP